MAKTLQFRRGTTSELSTITGAVGELFVDTTKDTVVVMDGSTAGGFPLATETYVSNQINNLLDGAPSVLNTLNELAAAIGDDANFITNINASIATKANSSSLSTVALSGSYNDLTDTPTFKTINGQSLIDSGVSVEWNVNLNNYNQAYYTGSVLQLGISYGAFSALSSQDASLIRSLQVGDHIRLTGYNQPTQTYDRVITSITEATSGSNGQFQITFSGGNLQPPTGYPEGTIVGISLLAVGNSSISISYNDLINKPTLVDLAEVSEDIIPTFSEVFDIGTTNKRWYNGYFSNTIDINGNILSGVETGLLHTSSNFSADSLISNDALIGQLLISDNFITPDNGAQDEYFGGKGALVVNGNLNVIGDWLNVPVVQTTQDVTVLTTGSEGFIRFNKDTTSFEGYDGVKWGSLGGIEADDNGNATIEANLIVSGSGSFTSLSISGATTLSGNTIINGTTSLNDDTIITGDVTISGELIVAGDVISLSDETKKENIIKVDSALDIVNAMNGVYYTLKDSPEKRHVGVIAQNVELVLPEVVYEKDGTKSVAYGNIVGVLIEAIKEQQIQIEELKAKLNGI